MFQELKVFGSLRVIVDINQPGDSKYGFVGKHEGSKAGAAVLNCELTAITVWRWP